MNVAKKDGNPKDIVAKGKIPLWLLSPIAAAQWALAQFAGMCKYGAWNWRVTGVRSSVYLSAMNRHMHAYLSGEETDPVDGTHHLGNIMACAAILLDAQAAGKLTDDRPPMVGLRPLYASLEALATKLAEQYKDENPRHCTLLDAVGPLPLPPRMPRAGAFGDMLAGLGVEDVAMAPSQPGAIGRAVIHTENPDPSPTSATIPSAQGPRHMTSIPLTNTNPDKDPPPSYAVEADPFPSCYKDTDAPPTIRSSTRGTEFIRPEHVVIPGAYHILHKRDGRLVESADQEDAAAAWTTMTAYQTFAEPGDHVSVIKSGQLIYSKVKE